MCNAPVAHLHKRVPAPLEERLALPGTAFEIAGATVRLDLACMTLKGAPAPDLLGVQVGYATTEPVAAIPLKPASFIRIFSRI